MLFDKTGITPINNTIVDFKKDKNISDPRLSFNAHTPELPAESEKSKVNSTLVKAYFGVTNSENIAPLTIEELDKLKDKDGNSRFGKNAKKIAGLSKNYPHIRDLVYMTKKGESPRFGYMNLLTLARFYEDEENRAAVRELAKFETSDGEPRFDAKAIRQLGEYGKYDRYSEIIKDLASIENDKNEPVFQSDEILALTDLYNQYKDDIKEMTQLTKEDGSPINLDGGIIFDILKCYGNHKETVVKLCTKRDFSKTLNQNLIEAYEKNTAFFDKVIDMKETPDSVDDYKYKEKDILSMGNACNNCPDAFFKLFNLKEQNIISPKTYNTIMRKTDDNSWRALNNPEFEKFFFENIDKIDSCKTFSSDNFVCLEMDGKKLNIKINPKNGFEIVGEETEIKSVTKTKKADGSLTYEKYYNNDCDEEIGSIEKVKDENGNTVSTELIKPSKQNPGVLVDIKNTYDKYGNFIDYERIGFVENYGENGERRKIQRNYISPSGIATKHTILEVPKGKRSCYEIGDKKIERVFKVKDENTTETYAWGNKYETKFNKDNMEVTITRKDGTQEKKSMNKDQVDFKLLPLIKQLPGDILFTISQTGTKIKQVKNWDKEMEDNACYTEVNNTIYISDKWSKDTFVFAHEYGHMIDSQKLDNLSKDSELKSIIKKELDAYKKNVSSKNEKCIEYFVSNENTKNGECFDELIAETTALLSGLQHSENTLLIRAKLLQENFPETIAYIGAKIENAMNN